MKAGKHVQVEIPLADSWADAEAVMAMQKKTGLTCMVGHTRRFNPSHQWIHRRIAGGELSVQQMDVQTYFFRRTNINALGQPRSWTDPPALGTTPRTRSTCSPTRRRTSGHRIANARALDGPPHPVLGIAMDMSVQLKTRRGAIWHAGRCHSTMTGRSGTFFRYICDNGTYIARYDDLFNGKEEKIDVSQVDVSTNGIELQDREFFAAIREGREPNASVAQVLPCYQVLGELETQLASQR